MNPDHQNLGVEMYESDYYVLHEAKRQAAKRNQGTDAQLFEDAANRKFLGVGRFTSIQEVRRVTETRSREMPHLVALIQKAADDLLASRYGPKS